MARSVKCAAQTLKPSACRSLMASVMVSWVTTSTQVPAPAASRLFGALMAMRKVGEKQLAELCMMRQSTVKQVLYRMLSDHFVAIEYVPKTPDRDCIKSFFLWSIDWVAIHKKVLQSMYDAVSNLLVKKRSVRKQIEIAEHDDAHKASDHAKTRWKRLCAAFEHLAAIIQRVDLQIALHRDF